MKQKKQGSFSPPAPPIHPTSKHTLARGEIRARTMARLLDEPDSLKESEKVIITSEVDRIVYPFSIELTNEHSLLVTGLLGKGAMGLVFRAVDQFKGEDGEVEEGGAVAVKIIHLDPSALGSNPEATRKKLYTKFISEVRLVRKLRHQNIIQIQVYGKTESPIDKQIVPYYAMEFLQGRDLEQIMKESKALPWDRVRRIMTQVCSALSAAHNYEEKGKRRPIIHQDIKPGNIFVTSDEKGEERVKILDFGIAQIAAQQKKKRKEGIFGTPLYMSPEQVMEMEIDSRTDIYSVGSTMYHLLSGRTTFPVDLSISECLKRIINEPPPPFAALGVDIHPEANRIIFKCLQKDPAMRYQSADELRADIEKCDGKKEAEFDTAVIELEPDVMRPNDHQYREIPAGPLVAEPTEIVQIADPAPKRKGKFVYGLIGAAGLAALAGGIIVFGGGKTKVEADRRSGLPEISIRSQI